MFKKITNEIKIEYKKNKVVTVFMGLVVLFSLLTYLKPGSTDSILEYIGISAVNIIMLSIVIVAMWYFLWRKR